MSTIAVRTKNNERRLRACSIKDLEAELDEINQQVNIYYNSELIGTLISVYGITTDDFMTQIKQKEK